MLVQAAVSDPACVNVTGIVFLTYPAVRHCFGDGLQKFLEFADKGKPFSGPAKTKTCIYAKRVASKQDSCFQRMYKIASHFVSPLS